MPKTRSEIDERYLWDLTSIFESDEAFLDALEAARTLPERYLSYKGTLSTAERLLEYLRLDDDTEAALGRLVNYASRKSDEDTRDSRYQDFEAQVMSLYVELVQAGSWFSNELLALGAEAVEAFYAECPELALYRRALDLVFRTAPHVLSPEQEELMAGVLDLSQQPGTIFSLLNDADLRFDDASDSLGEAHAVTHGSYIPLMMSPDRGLRRNAYESLYATYRQFRNTSAAVLATQMKHLNFSAKTRHYASSLEAALDRTEVPTEVYTNLIDAVHANLGALHKYIELRKAALGVEELHFYDLYVPIVDDVDMEFSYEEACELILAALEPMGNDYLALVRKGLSERWVDVYETPGKRSGAYSAGGYGMHPVILMNFQGKLDDVYTLIHEMGHSIHTYLSCETQPIVYSDYVIFVAEVASTCNEVLLTRYLLDKYRGKAEYRYILNHFLEQFRATFYRQTMFAEFELKAAELAASGAGVTADALDGIYRALNEDYFGPGIVADDEIAVEWSRIPHFYYGYYVYQYATGFAAAVALSSRILAEGAPAVKDYLGFLRGGSSKPPIELLKGAGVDMSATEPVEAALKLFDSLIDEMAAL